MVVDKGSRPERPSTPRHRVGRACDRCRSKKSKCDGASPCGRCSAHNEICVFRTFQKPQNKVYPKGYIELLEYEQAALVAAVHELYRRCIDNKGWDGPVLSTTPNGEPLTHEILNHLGALKQRPSIASSTSENDMEVDMNAIVQGLLSSDFLPAEDETAAYSPKHVEHQSNNKVPSLVRDDTAGSSSSQDSIDDLPNLDWTDASFMTPLDLSMAMSMGMNSSQQQPQQQPNNHSFQTFSSLPLSPAEIERLQTLNRLSLETVGVDLATFMNFSVADPVSTYMTLYQQGATEAIRTDTMYGA